MGEVFIGSEALAAGRLTRHDLQRWYRVIYRGVYMPKAVAPSLRDRTVGAWLATGRQGVVAGIAASALHGAAWIDADTPIELIARNCRPQSGLTVRNEEVANDETTKVAGLPVTTPARTAFDLGRHLMRTEAAIRMDALRHATPFSDDDVMMLIQRYRGWRGVRQLRAVLPLVDAGAQSPKETWLRLLLIDAGLPKPTTQIPVVDGYTPFAFLDMGWEEVMLAVEYDGDQHRSDRRQYVKDIRRLAKLEQCGWVVVRVIAEDKPEDVVTRVRDALRRREIDGMQSPTRTFAA